ncbi:Spc97/Spc98 [Artemisia annua]|uniref:Spc97/Spc98 n=1 Tax=Artemisia annua TaxID=35608 RepID=A0A2U1MKP3_ARTAN|nr:Spc97/Spc98 [Artemisia annua]
MAPSITPDESSIALSIKSLLVKQGIDGSYVLFDESVDGYIFPDSIKVGKSVRLMVRKLCELGWLFRKVKGYVDESVERFCDEDVGTVSQAFCAALQDELGEYYKLLAVLQAQEMNVIPLVSEGGSGKSLKGGAMAGAIHMHAQHGDPLLHMFRSWVLEGDLEDIFSEFFVLGQSVKDLKPSHCGEKDRSWADAATEAAAATGTTTRRGGLGYGETDALESLVTKAARRINKHLMDVVYNLIGLRNIVLHLMDVVYSH